MATEIGWAGLGIIPTFDKFAPELDRGTGKALAAAGSSGGTKFGQSAGRTAGKRFGSVFKTAAKASLVGLAGAGALAFKIGKDAIGEASELNESLNAVNVTYGKQSEAVKALGKEAAESLGLSNTEFNSLSVRFSAFSKTIAGGDGRKVVGTLDDLTTRAADFASVMNLEVADAAELFQSGLAGETEPLRKFGIDLSAAAVEAFAYKNGIAKAGEELTEQQKVQARYAYLMQQTSQAQGDFANTSDQLANQQRILGARFDNAKAKLGTALLPIMTDAVSFLNDKGIPAFEDFSKWFTDKGLPAIQDFADDMKPLVRELLPAAGDAIGVISDGVQKAAPYAKDLVEAFNDMPDWAKVALVGGGTGLLAGKKLGLLGKGSLLGSKGGGGLLGMVTKAKPLPVFVVNNGLGADGTPGKTTPGGRRGGKAGAALSAVAGGAAAYQFAKGPGSGALAGATTGAAIGAWGGPAGAGVGAAAGGAVGAVVGGLKAQKSEADMLKKVQESLDSGKVRDMTGALLVMNEEMAKYDGMTDQLKNSSAEYRGEARTPARLDDQPLRAHAAPVEGSNPRL